MEEKYEAKRHRLEFDYWLFQARRDLLLRLICQSGLKPNSKILDIGCAGGHLIKFLKGKGFKVSGLDISSKAIALCRKRGLKEVYLGDCLKTKFKNKTFDLLIADNVLEHLENDQKALLEWARILKRGGRLIIIVPAFQFLWSQHDQVCHHCRRYHLTGLVSKLKKAGFRIEKSSYWNFSLFLPALIIKTLGRLTSKKEAKKDQLYELNPLFNKLLLGLLKGENWLSTRIGFPFGISVFAVARKP
jgi:SAM-dependent methyltransferase